MKIIFLLTLAILTLFAVLVPSTYADQGGGSTHSGTRSIWPADRP